MFSTENWGLKNCGKLVKLKLIPPASALKNIMDEKTFWNKVLNQLKKALSRPIFQTWFVNTKVASFEENALTVACSSKFVKDTIEKKYFSLLKKTVDEIRGEKTKLSLKVQPSVFPQKTKKKQTLGPLFEKEKRPPVTKAGDPHLQPNLTFSNFAVSSTNELAYAAATAVAKSPGKAYNPLFLYGGVGVGKTHLMQAIGHEILKKYPDIKIIYCASEDFTNEIITAIKTKSTGGFKKRYRSANVLLIDDIQFIAGKTAVQEEFFHTFNTLQRTNGQIIMTSDKSPAEIANLENRLRSRFEGGLSIDIQAPNFELRTAILLIKTKQHKLELPMDIAKTIAANIESTRKLEGFLVRLKTEVIFRQIPLTLELVNNLLGKPKEEISQRKIKPQEILRSVAHFNQIKISDLKGPVRKKQLVESRHISMYLHRILLNLPLVEVGHIHGGRDHTTVMHAVEKITNELPSSEYLRNKISLIKKDIYE